MLETGQHDNHKGLSLRGFAAVIVVMRSRLKRITKDCKGLWTRDRFVEGLYQGNEAFWLLQVDGMASIWHDG